MKELILGIEARCSHGAINEIAKRCAYCEWEAYLAGKTLPFPMRFIGNKPLDRNSIYTVVGVMMKGTIANGPVPGLLLQDKDGTISNQTYDPTLFSMRLEPPA